MLRYGFMDCGSIKGFTYIYHQLYYVLPDSSLQAYFPKLISLLPSELTLLAAFYFSFQVLSFPLLVFVNLSTILRKFLRHYQLPRNSYSQLICLPYPPISCQGSEALSAFYPLFKALLACFPFFLR